MEMESTATTLFFSHHPIQKPNDSIEMKKKERKKNKNENRKKMNPRACMHTTTTTTTTKTKRRRRKNHKVMVMMVAADIGGWTSKTNTINIYLAMEEEKKTPRIIY